jgi:hypothetical protein
VKTIPDEDVLKQIEAMEAAQAPVKRKPGRPKGSKNKPGSKRHEFPNESKQLVDPKTGIVVNNNAAQSQIIARMGDERVTAFVQYHMDMMKMRQGVDKKNVPDLYNRFYIYLTYCAEHGVLPNNMNAYYAIGINKSDIGAWYAGRGTPEQRQFAEDIKQFFASIHEQAGGEAIVNPILSIYWSKAHDGMVEASKLEVVNTDPLGEKQSAEQIAEKYAGILPEDT